MEIGILIGSFVGMKEKPTKPRKVVTDFQSFSIHCGTYDFSFHVILSSDKKKSADFVNEKLRKDIFTPEDFEVLGKVFFRGGYAPVLWLPSYPLTNKEIGTLNHELLHIVFEVMGWAGISLSHSSEEAFTHLMKYITTQFYEQAKKPPIVTPKTRKKN